MILALAGLGCFQYQLHRLREIWTTDALRSVGLLIPVAALLLCIRLWKKAAFNSSQGSWLGLLPITAALALGLTSPLYSPRIHFSDGFHQADLHLAAAGLLFSVYASGVVLLLWGRAAWMRLRFPLALLLLVNPIPGAATALLDVPLQHFAATTARSFAGLLDVPVSAGTLKMMFSPELGIFIAPGCDGLRGVTVMGLVALILGHVYRLRYPRWAAYVGMAVLLAYLFNLVRLCGVIAYYWVALRIPALGRYGTEIDYAIGAGCFVAAAWFIVGFPRRGLR